MGANSIEQTNETKHLGLMRNSDNKIKVDERIRVGRKTFVGFILTRSLSVKISGISSRAWASCLEQANIAMSLAHVGDTTLRFPI
jgi:hypothetical protein